MNTRDTMRQGGAVMFTMRGEERKGEDLVHHGKNGLRLVLNRVTSSQGLGGRGYGGGRVVRAAYSQCSLQGATLHQKALDKPGH